MDELRNIILSEGSLTEKIACCIIPFILNSRTSRTNLLGQKNKNKNWNNTGAWGWGQGKKHEGNFWDDNVLLSNVL